MTSPLPIGPRFRRSLVGVAAVLTCLLVVACATRQLEPDFTAVSQAYADNLNWQMLLNLARLDQGHPAYFMAIGEVRIGHTQSGSLQGSGTSSHTSAQTVTNSVSRTVTNVLSGTLTPNASAAANPSFVFIPINSEEAAKQLLTPISVDVFNTLYQQGWPLDQLLRVLVERIEIRYDDKNKEPDILSNSLTRGSQDSFARFLRACEVVHVLQKRGGLSLETGDKFVPLSKVTLPLMSLREQTATGGREPTNAAPKEMPTIGAKELTDAADRSRVWQQVHGGWQLGTMRTFYRFRTDGAMLGGILEELQKSSVSYPRDQLINFKDVLNSAVVAQPDDAADTKPEANAGPGEPATRPLVHTVLVLRSFRNALEAVAQEQRAYDALEREYPGFIRANIPERQRRPVLRTDWAGDKAPLLRPVVSLSYAGVKYKITDPVGDPLSIDSRWNRDVFRLLINLSYQVTVDITKFQRQVLELNQ